MAEEIISNQQELEPKDNHGALDFDSLYFIEEIEQNLPSHENDHSVTQITFKDSDQHMGLAAALIAEYLAMNPPLDGSDSITISRRTARILEKVGIPFHRYEPEKVSGPHEIIPFPYRNTRDNSRTKGV